MKILVVDDDSTNRHMIKLWLTTGNLSEVTLVEDSDQALAALRSEKFDRMFTDNDMRIANEGLTLITEAKKVQPELRIIFMSGDMSTEKMVDALERGAEETVCKLKMSAYLKKLLLSLGS